MAWYHSSREQQILYRSKHAVWSYIKENLDTENWDWYFISKYNKNITTGVIRENMDLVPWNFFAYTDNINNTWNFVKEFPDKNWNWYGMVLVMGIDWDFILKNPEKDWDWDLISIDSDTTWEIVSKNLEKLWRWTSLSKNYNMTEEIVKANPNHSWMSVKRCCYTKPNSFENYYRSYTYRKPTSLERMNVIRFELLKKALNPNRSFNWNEDLKYDFSR
jgi:hypothetical protein